MAKEVFVNVGISTLSADINNSVTSLTVTSGTWPASGQFRLKLDNEIVIVTAVAGLVFTVTRGAEGTTAASHTAGIIVFSSMTDASLRLLNIQSIDGVQTTMRRELNFLQDQGVYTILVDDGTNDKVDVTFSSGGLGKAFVKPVLGNFTARNAGTATFTQSGSGIYLKAIAVANAYDVKVRDITPGAAPWSVVANIQPAVLGKSKICAGLCFIENGTSKMHRICFGEGIIKIDKMTSATAFSADYVNPIATLQGAFNWVRLQDDNTNRIISVSVDGTNWIVLHTVGRTDFFTADRVGVFVDANNVASPNYDAGLMLMSWKLN